ncbi:hypothetical protein P153DRAFT_385638 [Dothidotthia symphoricarpi CBS 119687]|uniref:Uncharacterized protein n=1 Tax=Dothidotthia symphoricarpi CBS 119687 TaxID=1392245 RepID=A0A6A6AC87_9PLEO|nr:uncharacterized protein P153DRAFT_385638 [Dothidotthia symphoricarpi CBS 119687]KAF2129429.1 hypothetical protein P153DRAFT_385638 [Dothidotthia symphoricarpi CBS 119687]
MPYIIHVPQIPRPFISNNPNIFMDCHSWGWNVESRPYSDSFCRAARNQENARFEGDRRAEQLEGYWTAELERRERMIDTGTPAATNVERNDAKIILASTRVFGKHVKNDSVQGVVEFMQPKGLVVQVVEVDEWDL